MDSGSVAGWYGKLPSLGDFASRRLPAAFVEAWDDWLARGLAAWRDADPGWIEAYLAAPTWCFVIGPRVLRVRGGPSADGPAWAGVLMPSVDRVGRYFPLTVAQPQWQLNAAAAPHLAHWLQHAAARAVDALHEDWSAERFDEALADLGDLTWPLPVADAGLSELGAALDRIAGSGDGTAWWLPVAHGDRALRQTAALPSGAEFVRLLGGQPAGPAPAR